MRPTDAEGVVSGIWNAILGWAYRAVHDFITRPEQCTSQGGFSDLMVLHYIEQNHIFREYDFLVVQCKRMSSEGQPVVWDTAREQLRGYLPTMKPLNQQHRVYGL